MKTWLFTLFAAALGATAMAGPGGSPFYKTYWKERDPLRLDPSVVAMYRATPVGLTDVGGPLATRLDWDGALDHPVEGWVLVPLTTPLRSEADARATIAALAAGTDAFVSPVFIDRFGQPSFVTDDVFVGVQPKLDPMMWDLVVSRRLPGQIVDRGFASMPGVYRIDPASNDGFAILDAANAIATDPDVAFAEPGMVASGRNEWIPNDPEYGNLWGLRNTGQFSGGLAGFDMGADPAWDVTIGANTVRTLVMDSGVDRSHPDIAQIAGQNFTSEGNGQLGGPTLGFDNHGTAVAGCISAIANNGIGVAGIAPGTIIVSAKPYIGTGGGGFTFQFAWVANALAWGTSIGCRVSNNSNAYGGTSATIDNAYQTARNGGMIHFVSAGNNNVGTLSYPSNLPSVNAVMAMDWTGNRAGFSSWGPGVDFAAPGAGIRTTDRQGAAGYDPSNYCWIDGTSFASPYTAGVAALVISRHPGLTVDQIEQRMQATTRDLGAAGYDTTFGWGLVRADQALAGVRQPTFVVRGRVWDGPNGVAGQSVAAWTYGEDRTVVASPGLPISDFATTVSPMRFPVSGTVSNIDVSVNIAHTYIGDLVVILTGPDSTSVVLHNRTGGNTDNLVTNYPINTVPAQSLAAFSGKFSGGTWTLTVADQASGDSGTLVSWGLHMVTNGIARGVATDAGGNYVQDLLPEGDNYYFYPFNTGSREFTPAWRLYTLGPSRSGVDFFFVPQAFDVGTINTPWQGWVWDTPGTTVRWYKFNTLRRTDGIRYLDIDTEGTNGFGTDDDTEIGVYASDGTLVASNDDSGSGNRSLLSFGPEAPLRPPFGDGSVRLGQNGYLNPGTYYLAVAGYNTTFQNGFNVVSSSGRTGSIQVNFRSNLGSKFLSGRVDVGGYLPGPNGQTMNVQVRNLATGAPVANSTAVLNGAGNYECEVPATLTDAAYRVHMRGADLRWLGRLRTPVNMGAQGASGVDFVLLLGNINGDNRVDLDDFLILASTYEVSPPLDPAADLNGDGAVNLDDFLILASVYEVAGDD